MLEQTQLVGQFQTLLDLEQEALATYTQLAAGIVDPAISAKIEQLIHDKQRHVKLVRRLLEIVEG